MKSQNREFGIQSVTTRQRISAIKNTLNQRLLKAQLGAELDRRYCKRLPFQFSVWFVIGLGMFSGDNYRQVFRWLTPLGSDVPLRSTLTEARKRLGYQLFEKLYFAVVTLLGDPKDNFGFYDGLRLMAFDGFTLNTYDSASNRRVFGRPKNGRSYGPQPQTRCLALAELGTHVIWRTVIGTYRQGEMTLIKPLFQFLNQSMLVLLDRNFLSFDLVEAVIGQKAQYLIRVKINRVLPVLKRLDDGSYLSRIYKNVYDRQKDRNGIDIRIIEYTLDDPDRAGCGELHRLATSLLDVTEHPAEKLIVLYHQRWEEELAFDELKTHLLERPVLRSKTPDGVRQEIYALLITHFIIRKIMFQASVEASVAPTRISFTATMNIIKSKLAEVPNTERGVSQWLKRVIVEAATEVLPVRNGRINPRVRKKTTSHWERKKQKHRNPPQPTSTFEDSIVILV